jgi:hypothetical protein
MTLKGQPYKPLLDIFTAGYKVPRGYDRLLLKATRPDLRTRNGLRWKMSGRVESPEPADGLKPTGDVCPQFVGDGLSLAKTAVGMAQGDYSPTTVLVVAVRKSDVIAEDDEKVKVRGCLVLDLIDGLAVVRTKCAGADLNGANLYGADLYGADLNRANLYGANLYGADLYGANLNRANLGRANLYGANLNRAYADRTTVWPDKYDPKKAGVIVL